MKLDFLHKLLFVLLIFVSVAGVVMVRNALRDLNNLQAQADSAEILLLRVKSDANASPSLRADWFNRE